MVKATEITFSPGKDELESVLLQAIAEIVSRAENINRVWIGIECLLSFLLSMEFL